MKVVGNKTGTCALDFVGTRLHGLACAGLRDDWRILGFDGNGLKGLFAGFDYFGHACNRSTRTDCRNKDIHFTIRIAPNFLRRCFLVNGRVGRIFKLLGDERAGNFLCEGFRSGDRAFHSLCGGCEFEFGTKKGKKSAALEAHTFGHREDQLVPFGRGDEGKCDSRIA